MYNTKILTANEFSKFEDIYEDFRTKAASDYNFELEPLDYDGFLDAIDKDLIGGMVIRIGDRVVDSSIKTKIYELTKELTKIQLVS